MAPLDLSVHLPGSKTDICAELPFGIQLRQPPPAPRPPGQPTSLYLLSPWPGILRGPAQLHTGSPSQAVAFILLFLWSTLYSVPLAQSPAHHGHSGSGVVRTSE